MTLLGPLWFVPLHEAINAFKAQRFAMLNERVSQGCRRHTVDFDLMAAEMVQVDVALLEEPGLVWADSH